MFIYFPILPWVDKTVSRVLTGSCSESENKLFLPAAVAVSLKLMQKCQTEEQKTHSNRRVRRFVWPSFCHIVIGLR